MPQPTEAEFVQRGFSVKRWELTPTTTVGNYYTSVPLLKTNIGPQEPLHFRTIEFGATAADDKLGKIYQATHLHIPLLNRGAALAREAVTGFNVEDSPAPAEEFGVLNGIPNIVPFKGLRIFSENQFVPPLSSVAATNEIDNEHDDIPRIDHPAVPDDLWANVTNGQQLYYFDLSRSWHPFKIQYLYNSQLYFVHKSGSIEITYRALYFLESLRKVEGDVYSGRHQVVGFGVSATKKLRGLGGIGTFFADKVLFEPQ